MTTNLRVLVSGSSIAGPAAACWLAGSGHTVTLIERSPQPRTAGQNIDVRGPGRQVLRRMGIERQALDRNTGEIGTRFVDEKGRALLELAAGNSDSDGSTAQLEILRGELSDLLTATLPDDVAVRYGHRISDLRQDDDGVTVTLNGKQQEHYDLVVIAEGTRSATRAMVFGDVPTKVLGLYTAFGTIPRSDDDDRYWNWLTTSGGRSVTVRPDNRGTTRIALSFLSPPRGYEELPADAQKSMLAERFGDIGWKVPRILGELAESGELYLDNLTQVFAPRYGKGRVVLLGDAGWCTTPLSGQGTTLALTGAYVLAGELARHRSIEVALRAYQQQMSSFVEPAQKLPPGGPRILHPRTGRGLAMLHTALRIAGSRPVKGIAGIASRIPTPGSRARGLPDYPELVAQHA